jgi:integrase/recombinase XerD
VVTEDLVSSVLLQTQEQMTGIDQVALRRILEGTIASYDIKVKEGMGVQSDLPAKIEAYLSCRRLDGMSESTLRNYRYHLNRFARFVQKRVNTITTADLRAFLADLVEVHKLKNTTLETEKSTLKSFFAWLEEEEYVLKSPAKKIRPTKCEKRVRKSLTLEELELMRDACKTPRERCMLELFYSTGVRLDELCKMNVMDFNWTDNSIHVIGKGNKERVVYFSDKSRIYIKKYLLARGSTLDPAVFITYKNPHKRLSKRSIEQEIGVIAQHAGLDKRVFPHLLRHSFATQGAKSGMSLQSLHELLGHSSINTTMVYVDRDPEAAAYEHKRLLNQ